MVNKRNQKSSKGGNNRPRNGPRGNRGRNRRNEDSPNSLSTNFNDPRSLNRVPRSINMAINSRSISCVFLSIVYNLNATAVALPATANNYYRAYLRFFPTLNEALPVNPTITLSNSSNATVTNLGIIPDNEYSSWSSLYSLVKMSKVKVSFRPSITMGLVTTSAGSSLSASTTITHLPILDNIDDVLAPSPSNLLAVAPTVQGFTHMRQRPLTRTSSIYKPWNHEFSPTFFQQKLGAPLGQSAQSTQIVPVSPPWFDLLSTSGSTPDPIDGFYLVMPSINLGGFNPTTAQFPTALGDTIALGQIEVSYLVHFKSRE